MTLPRITPLVATLALILLLALPGAAGAQGPAPNVPVEQPPPVDAASPSPDAAPQKASDGHWFMPARSQPEAAAAAPQDSGGPDDFGYTWNDWEPLAWINGSGGTNTSIDNSTDHAGPIDIGFPFRFYENVRSQLYISRFGFLAFSSDNLWNDQSEIPSPEKPDEVIAPHWAPLDEVGGYVRYLRGGTAPNRWFTVEWNRVRGTDDGVDEYTFEVILHESGDIVFQYATMTTNGNYWCQASGIEDSTGLDGLSTSPWCDEIAPNHAVRITRPAPAARVALAPRAQGAFSAAGAVAQFSQTVRNTGEFGIDTYDLSVNSPWPTTLYQADSSTPLTDTDGDGIVDTGPMDQGGSKTIVVKTALPAGAVVGDSNAAQLTAISSRNPNKAKTASFQTGVPAKFAQTYSQSGSPKVGFYRPDQQATRQTADPYGYGPALASAPDGSIVQVWYQGRSIGNNRYVNELYYAVLDNRGNVIRPAARLVDLGGASTSAYDYNPAVAVAPDGRVGITWSRELWNSSNSTSNYNIYFMVLDGNGAIVKSATNLTNNASWGTWETRNLPQFYYPSIATTADGRFGLAWERQAYDGSSWPTTTWYAVRRSDGGQVKAPTQFSSNARSYYPNLTALADGTLFMVQETDGQLGYGRIDSSGNIVTGLTTLPVSYPQYPDAIQLPNGNIVLAWTDWNVGYAVLNPGLGIVKDVTWLPNISPMGDYYISVTRSGNGAVLTWSDECCGYQPNLYYALLDGEGDVITWPMIFFSDYAGSYVRLPYNGQGNTPLLGDLTPPIGPSGLASPSHSLNAWSSNNTVDVIWTAAVDDDSGLDGYSILWDHAPATLPDATKDLGAVTMTTSPALAVGDWYFHIRAVDKAGNWAPGAAHLGPFKIDATPPVSAARSPEFIIGAIPVTWSGTDAGSGIVAYDVWVRDGLAGSWTKWQANTTATTAAFASPVVGHTYYFRSVARDAVGNIETDLPADGDSHTTAAAIQVTGQILNNQQQPVFNATVMTQPAVLNVAHTDGNGRYVLYLVNTGVFNVTAARTGYGALPALHDLTVNSDIAGLDFVLPPEQDAVVNGGWETGDLTGWQVEPGATVAASPLAAHTGLNGLRFGSPVAAANTAMPQIWQIAQTISLPAELTKPTLSWFYRVVSGTPGESLLIQVSNGTNEVTREILLASSGWMHAWMDLGAFSGQTVTLRIGLLEADPREVYLDEISIGATQVGVYPVRLPLITRQ
jgi:hypothetical protein